MKAIILSLLILFYASTVFSVTPEDGIYVLLSSADNNLSAKDMLVRFYELPRFIIVEGEITDLRGEFFYPSDCTSNNGTARLDLSSYTAVQKKEDGLFFVNKELYINLDQPQFYSIYAFADLFSDQITAYSVYGRDVVHGILRFESPTEAVYSLTSAQAFFTGEGLDVGTCITQETARLVKIQ